MIITALSAMLLFLVPVSLAGTPSATPLSSTTTQSTTAAAPGTPSADSVEPLSI